MGKEREGGKLGGREGERSLYLGAIIVSYWLKFKAYNTDLNGVILMYHFFPGCMLNIVSSH